MINLDKQQLIDKIQFNDDKEVDLRSLKLNYERRLDNLIFIQRKIFACDDVKTKQYLLYVMCNRAKLWRITKKDLLELVTEVAEHSVSCDGDKYLKEYQIHKALSGYDDGRKISNLLVYQKTGIMNYGDDEHLVLTRKELSAVCNKMVKERIRERIIFYLRRYMKREKKYTVDEIIMMLEKNGLTISKSTLYRDKVYKMILSGFDLRKKRGKDEFCFYSTKL